MSQLPNLCSHIQNSFRSRLLRISIPQTKMNLAVVNVLYEQGFIASVARGNKQSPDATYVPTTNANISTRRYWLELKYRENQPVLSQMKVISKPSRHVTATVQQLRGLVAGQQQGIVKPALPGEIIVVATSKGVLEVNDAIRQNVGGKLLCRVR
ncbi:30S ribosomal protein S8 [Thamnocephalis sphaerospora]|uniref:30S ribosomal protein S8 n=1 Tax=Thamnocephalis sphaerospora TaxID=78915 RepID=A0A4P9XQP1_9FUNG|nr:30S ribosomal protein S8 [Thamnocephalis sphaerospora]|eukprot:RKP07821.1 30S ribosomal protein S8 [Thamnocephalis sphaerospora]